MSEHDTEPHTATVQDFSDHLEIRLDDLTILPLEPDDVIVLRLPDFSMRHAARARQLVMEQVPGHKVLVFAKDVELTILRPPRIVVVDRTTGADPGLPELLDPGAFPGDTLADLRTLSELPNLPTVDRMSINPVDSEYFKTLFPGSEPRFWGRPIPADTPVDTDADVPKEHVRVHAGARDYVIQLPPRLNGGAMASEPTKQITPGSRPVAVLELTQELVEALDQFIRARLDEMEQSARAVQRLLTSFDRPPSTNHSMLSAASEFFAHYGPEQEPCDVAATRRLVDHLMKWTNLFLPMARQETQALILLASRWQQHPDWAALIAQHAKPLVDTQVPS